jgi:hypothetical protein
LRSCSSCLSCSHSSFLSLILSSAAIFLSHRNRVAQRIPICRVAHLDPFVCLLLNPALQQIFNLNHNHNLQPLPPQLLSCLDIITYLAVTFFCSSRTSVLLAEVRRRSAPSLRTRLSLCHPSRPIDDHLFDLETTLKRRRNHRIAIWHNLGLDELSLQTKLGSGVDLLLSQAICA